jgi:hypothetical protein
MPTLEFECPRTERCVSTGIEVDEASYKGISYSTTFIHCPHCPVPHRLSHVRSWLSGGKQPAPYTSEQHAGLSQPDPETGIPFLTVAERQPRTQAEG